MITEERIRRIETLVCYIARKIPVSKLKQKDDEFHEMQKLAQELRDELKPPDGLPVETE